MQYMNFGWLLDNEVAGSQGPVNLQDLFFLYQQGVRAVIRMEERTIRRRHRRLRRHYRPVRAGY